jgi:hypothetical protein
MSLYKFLFSLKVQGQSLKVVLQSSTELYSSQSLRAERTSTSLRA